MTTERHPHEIFEGLETPAPPPELRQQVLHRASLALAEPSRPGPWVGLWHSPALRLAWGAAASILLMCHVAITPRTSTLVPSPELVAADEAISQELAEIVFLPPLRLDARGPAVAAHDPDLASDDLPKPTTPPTKERVS